MKIDGSSPRIPLNRLKHPLRQKPPRAAGDDENAAPETSAFSENFERDIVRDGAKRFEKWLEKLEIK